METLITKGIKICAETQYQQRFIDPKNPKFIFTYRITIENTNDFTVQLVSRHWVIKDANNWVKEITGEGVIGKQPILDQDDRHRYSSWTFISSEIGKMSGSYLMRRLDTDESFRVHIPEFNLVVPFKLN